MQRNLCMDFLAIDHGASSRATAGVPLRLWLHGRIRTRILVKVFIFVIAQVTVQQAGNAPNFDMPGGNTKPLRHLLPLDRAAVRISFDGKWTNVVCLPAS